MYTKKITYSLASTSVYIDNNIFYKSLEIMQDNLSYTNIHIITDFNVYAIYKDRLSNIFGTSFGISLVPSGEEYKTLDTINQIYGELALNNVDKSWLIVSFGGGVIGDISSFIAATYYRGLQICHIPTTLTAQIDSCIGGKCGFDTEYGKNLVGLIYHPSIVIIDPILLNTMPVNTFNFGIAEVIKYGCINNADILNKLLAANLNILEIIKSCIDIKIEYIQKDEFDRNERMILNFGHTVGHAIEKLSNFKNISHGEAISIGIVYALKISEYLGVFSGEYKIVIDCFKKYNLPTSTHFPKEQILDAVLYDKKFWDNKIRYIILENLGNAKINTIQIDDFRKYINEITNY